MPLIVYERPFWARVTWTFAFWSLLVAPTTFLLCLSIGLRTEFSNLILVIMPLSALVALIGAGRLWQGDRSIVNATELLRADECGIRTSANTFLAWDDISRVRRVSLGNGGTIYQILQHPSDTVFVELQASQIFGNFEDLADALLLAKEAAEHEQAKLR